MNITSRSFYGILTPQEVAEAVSRVCATKDLLIYEEEGDRMLQPLEVDSIVRREQTPLRNRFFIVCRPVTRNEIRSVDPPPNIVIEHPIEGAIVIEQTWIAYKLKDDEIESDCAVRISSGFRAIVKSLRKNFVGHTVGYFESDPSAKGEYREVKYSAMALNCFREGMQWRDGSVILEPAPKS